MAIHFQSLSVILASANEGRKAMIQELADAGMSTSEIDLRVVQGGETLQDIKQSMIDNGYEF